MAMENMNVVITATDRTTAALQNIKASMGGLISQAGTLSAALAGIGAGFSAGALTAGIKQAINDFDNLGKMAQKVGVSVETLSGLDFAGKLSDVSLEAIGTGLKKLSVNMADAAKGGGESAAVFKALGISVKDAAGNLRSSDEVFADIADAFAGMEDGAGKTNIAIKLLGKAGADLIPLLNQGSKGINSMKKEAEEFGALIGTDLTAKSEQFNDNLTRLNVAMNAFKVTLASGVIDDLNNLASGMLAASKASGGFWKGLLLLDGAESQNPVAALEKIEGSIERLKKLREELANSTVGKSPLAGLPLLGVSGDIADIDRQLALLTTKQKALRDLANQRGAFDFGPPVISPDKTKPPNVPDGNASKVLSDYVKFTQAIEERIAVSRLSLNTDEKLTEAAKEMARFESDLATGKIKMTETEANLSRARIESLDVIQRQAAANSEAMQQAKKEAEELQRMIDSTDVGKNLKGMRGMAAAELAFGQGKIDAEQFEQIKRNLMGLKDESDETFRDLQQAIEGWGRASADAIADFVIDGKASFSDLANSILRDLARMVAYKTITEPLFKGISKAFDSGGGGLDFGGVLGEMLGGFFGGIFGGGRASGGPVVPGQYYVVGENGPEVLVPGMSGTVIPNGGGMGGGTVVNVIEAPGKGGQTEQRTEGGVSIVDVFVERISSKLASDVARGDGALPAALSSTYGLNRVAGAY